VSERVETTSSDHDCLVIGAGPAGLGAAAMLKERGRKPLIVERAEAVAAAWRSRYDGFRLNTSSWFSYLPGERFPRSAGRWPTREALVAYYERYAARHALAIQTETTVERIERGEAVWRVVTGGGELSAPLVVVATGKYRTPVVPDWPGREGFSGELIHSAEYRKARPYEGKRVLVVGPGNSGFEIATQLERGHARSVWLSVRTPPHIIHREIGPFPADLFAVIGRRLPVPLVDAAAELIRRLTIGDLSKYGLEAPPDGLYERLKRTGMIPTADGRFLGALKAGQLQVVPPLETLETSCAILADGSRLEIDAVIAATGYRRDLEPLVGHLGLLDEDGHPLFHAAETHRRAPGLHFIGFSEPLSGNMRQLRFDARKIARAAA